MSFSDVIKSSVYESFGSGADLPIAKICLILLTACLVGIYIYFVYKSFSKSQFYSKDLNMTLTGMTIAVAAIMVAMQASLLVSLGMVGALSIVRFRTAVKNPLDLLYLFWAISEGIICGVGLYMLGVVLCVIMTVALWLLGKVPNNKAPALMVIRTALNASVEDISEMIKGSSRYSRQTAVTVKNGCMELIYQLNCKQYHALIKRLQQVEGVLSVNYVEHQGEMRT